MPTPLKPCSVILLKYPLRSPVRLAIQNYRISYLITNNWGGLLSGSAPYKPRGNMKKCSKCKEWKDESEFYKSNQAKDGIKSECKQCAKQYREEHKEEKAKYQKQYRQEHKEQIAKYREKHKEKIKQCEKQYRQEHKEERKEYSKQYRIKNKEKIKEYDNKHKEKRAKIKAVYRKNNRGLMNAHLAKYRAMKLNATPAYADLNAISRIYRTASILSKMIGRKMQVDHIIPLQSKLVCGLHHEDNLQIISAERNLRKSNKFDPKLKSE